MLILHHSSGLAYPGYVGRDYYTRSLFKAICVSGPHQERHMDKTYPFEGETRKC